MRDYCPSHGINGIQEPGDGSAGGSLVPQNRHSLLHLLVFHLQPTDFGAQFELRIYIYDTGGEQGQQKM